jgi:phospholipase/lecithinase/hemolysin
MNLFCLFLGMIWVLVLSAAPSRAAFSSIYIFGDGVSATTNYPNSANYYGNRYSNGRCWVEFLAQRQGLGASSLTSTNWTYSTNNRSFYGHFSYLMVTNVLNFSAPANASNCLFVLWVANADYVGDVTSFPPPNSTNMTSWTNSLNQHLTNHVRAITNLYAKGMRTLIAPNAVDLMKVPQYASISAGSPGYRAFVRQRIIDFNNAYSNRLNQIRISNPGLTIITPDFFALIDDAEANAGKYGLTNVLDDTGDVTSAQQHLIPAQASVLNGPGTNYVWWGQIAPSARFHEVLADTAQQLLSPVSLDDLTQVNTSNLLTLANAPVGAKGVVEFLGDAAQNNWQTNSFFTVSNTTQTVFLTPTNDVRFYRVKFPWQWSWP